MEIKNYKKIVVNFILIFIASFASLTFANATTYLDFEEFPVTNGSVPGDSENWQYRSSVTNSSYPANMESETSGWTQKVYDSDGYDWFWLMRFHSCYDHIGVDTFGYLTITNDAHSGEKALKHTVTGGKVAEPSDDGSCESLGTELYNLESYTGSSDIYTDGNIGHPYMYFKKVNSTRTSRDTSPFTAALNKNRWSMYANLPAGLNNGIGGYNNPVRETYQIGVFEDPANPTSHEYFNFHTQGGGWVKFQIDETSSGTQSNSTVVYYPDFWHTVWQWYVTAKYYNGTATPPYSVTLDDIEFTQDDYAAQNNWTISNLAVLYRETDDSWEISLSDKYGRDGAHSTYEVRYSTIAPITNENWESATPVEIQADSRFHIMARNDGKFSKWWPYYKAVWAPFRLTAVDTVNLAPGSTIHFAVKDVSQVNNTVTPIDGINDYWDGSREGGRPYDTQPANYDWANDEAALPLIKRISYTLSSTVSSDATPPASPSGLSVM